MNVSQIAKALEAADFEVTTFITEDIDLEDHSVGINNTNFHVSVHPDEVYFQLVERSGADFIFYGNLTIEEIISTVRAA